MPDRLPAGFSRHRPIFPAGPWFRPSRRLSRLVGGRYVTENLQVGAGVVPGHGADGVLRNQNAWLTASAESNERPSARPRRGLGVEVEPPGSWHWKPQAGVATSLTSRRRYFSRVWMGFADRRVGGGGGLLDGDELAGVVAVLTSANAWTRRMAADEAHPPADHIQPLEGMDFDADLLGGRLEEAGWADRRR